MPDLRRLWSVMVTEIAESGTVLEFAAPVELSDGVTQVLDVVRVGVFNAVSGGAFLDWDIRRSRENFIELARQPTARFTGPAEDLAAAGEQFDVILNMEVIEHVADPAQFAATCAGMLKPGGLMFVATLNRTLKAFGLAIIGAEYVLGWLPKGTHQWEKFITPDELKSWLAAADCPVVETSGVTYSPLSNTWRKAADTDVNYMVVSRKNV